MATKLYLHASTSVPSGTLPTTEQSALTSANDFEADQATNRVMDTTIGVSQTSLANASTGTTNATDYYIARWVSPILWQGSISANTWDYKSAMQESNAAANFPRNATGALYVNCYVWNLRTGTKTGTILDGNTAADGEESTTSETLIECTFTGAAVSGIESGQCVIVFEAWARVTQGNGTSRTQTFYFDGTTESSTTTNAAHISTPEDLQFTQTAGNTSIIQAGYSGIASTANTTQYWSPAGRIGVTTTEAETQIPIRYAGTLKMFQVRLESNAVVGDTTFTVRKNAADTTMVAHTVSNVIGIFEDLDTSHNVTVAAGDKISIKSVPGAATNTFLVTIFSLLFVPDDPTKTVQIFSNAISKSFTGASATRYIGIQGESNDTVGAGETQVKCRQRVAGTYKNLFIYISANARTTDTVWKSRKNGADGNLIITVGAGQTGLFEDTSNSDTITVDDDYNLSNTTGTGSENITFTVLGVSFESTSFQSALVTGKHNGAVTNVNLTHYVPLGGAIGTHTTESRAFRKIRNSSLILKDFFVYVSANTITANTTYTVRVNGTDTAITLTVGSSATGLFSDTTHSINVGSNDDVDVKIITGATGTSITYTLIALYYHTGQLNKEYTHKYNIRNLIADTFTHKWNIRNLISDTFTHIYDILEAVALVAQTYTHKYNIKNLAAGTYTHKWNIRNLVSDTFTHIWNIKNLIADTFTHKWNIKNLIADTFTHIANIKNLISDTFTHKWNIWNLATGTYTHKWNIRNLIAQTYTHFYDILTTVLMATQTYTHRYNIRNLATGTYTHKWNIKNLISQIYTHKYGIKNLISQIFTHKWNIRNLANQVFTHKWNIRNLATKLFTHKWNIRNLAAKTFTHFYDILTLVNQVFTHKYNIKNLASKTFTHFYDILQTVGVAVQSYTHKYNIRNLTSQTYTHKWNIKTLISQIYTHKYGIKALISQIFTHKYGIKNLVAKVYTHVYGIRNLIAKTFTHFYDILEMLHVSQTFTHIYNILGNPVTIQRIGGKPPGGNAFRRKFEKQRKKWNPDWGLILRKRLGMA